ncbi:hypothetical protein [Yoonia sp. 208BN28-4]|uniref:hypothetical protein n=1 Tax=Yoonia sp. 208BN28-4 TaxID=3126505 RepID=UPI0030ACD0F4
MPARVQKVGRDVSNLLRYGRHAPLTHERLFVDPQDIKLKWSPRKLPERIPFHEAISGTVRDGDWDLAVKQVCKERKYRACAARFVNGKSWEDTGIIDNLMKKIARDGEVDGCFSRAELLARYAALDRLYAEIRAAGRLKTRDEIGGHGLREELGILCHIGRDGTLIRARNGHHRFAVAQILKLPVIPIQIGFVHKNALRSGQFQALRVRSRQLEHQAVDPTREHP